ncbi:calpain family cysteine protease containing protein [Stylonychia lemnae]|uniref:Calpain family cysteine protease containing protein n=1 Tax=Stylonychia lemnae TaxID=5949 RepID=A0A077ZW20_STYLE|nr:calpain family cysteine protease containing protein [Stylonychia lemnae]|eukprot:CDW72641.1 calpain family cysteine protease containing protein [Stylonychia lemnae]
MRQFEATILLAFGVSLAAASQSGIQRFIRTLPQTKQKAYSCSTAIDRVKAPLPDYKKIVSSYSNFWNDSSFPADGSSISWQGTRFTDNRLKEFVSNKWERLNNLCPKCTLYGTEDFLNDVSQGVLGDCYFLSGISAVAEINSRFEKAIVNPQINWAGLYAFNVFIRGIPHVLVVDDSIPTGIYGKKPIFAGIGSDNSIWGPLLEKAWAKTNVNYEMTIGGYPNEAYTFLTNMPNMLYLMSDVNTASMWTILSQADAKNWIMSINTPASPGGDKDYCEFNLPCTHAYSLLSTVTVYNKDKSQSFNLIKIRNPWKQDSGFSGSFADSSPIWETVGLGGKTYAQQAKRVIADDGVYYMTDAEVMSAFSAFNVGEYYDNFVTSWYDKRNDQVANANSPAIYKFTLKQATPMYIRVITYERRMYPISCKPDSTELKLELVDASGKTISSIEYEEEKLNSINLVNTPLATGSYTLKFSPKWKDDDVKDYGIIINAPRDIEIKDSNGKTSRLTGHDFGSKGLKASVKQAPKPLKPLPDIKQSGPAYELTGNLDQDIVKIRNSKSLPIENGDNGQFLSGTKSSTVSGNRQAIAQFLGTLDEMIIYYASIYVSTKPGYKFKYSAGNDKCSITKNSSTGNDDIKCDCTITPDKYPKECLLVLVTKEGEDLDSYIDAGASSI